MRIHTECIAPRGYNIYTMVTVLIRLTRLQPPKYLIIVVNRFRYINNNFDKDRCTIPMGMTVVLGLHKFSLQATIDHHGPSVYSGHFTKSISCWKKSIATTATLQSLNDLYQKLIITKITPMALAHPLHPIRSRSRNKRRNLWVGWCVSSWRP